MEYRKMYINGKLTDAKHGKRKKIICPATEEVIAEVAWGDREDALHSLESAKAGFEFWSKTTINERVNWMKKLAEQVNKQQDSLRECLMLETGKPWDATYYDAHMIVDCLEFFAEELKNYKEEIIPDRENNYKHLLVRQPLGPVVAILAWNFPLLNVGYKVGPALASGCSIVLKPSASTPVSTLLFGEICHKIGFPPGVLNIVTGDSETIGETLVRSDIPRMITIIGSSETGKRIVGLSNNSIKKFSLELGGNAPVIIFNDADIKKAALDIVGLKFANTGQVCVSPNRVFIQQDVHSRFVEEAIKFAKNIRLGSGKNIKADMGPLINSEARNRIMKLVRSAVQSGAKIVWGGKIPEGENFKKGYYYMPTILTDVSPDMDVAKQEIFGPVLPILSFREEEEVIRLSNETEYGLSAYVYTTDLKKGLRIPEKLHFGNVLVNGVKYEVYLPHGGLKESGIGKDCSHLSLEEYSYIKRISISIT
jgi:succinate-semialdehyde dehydrogenase/glutarate-semialdehyde dehydrogenase